MMNQYNFKPPELTREVNVSNLVLKMDGKIQEITDFAKQFAGQFEPGADEVLNIIIEKLDKI